MVHACGAYKSLFLKGKASLILQEGSYALVQVFMGREACKPRCGIAIKSKGHFREIVFAPKYDVPKKSIITHNKLWDMDFEGTSFKLRCVFVVFLVF